MLILEGINFEKWEVRAIFLIVFAVIAKFGNGGFGEELNTISELKGFNIFSVKGAIECI
jgi:hypothetical protein